MLLMFKTGDWVYRIVNPKLSGKVVSSRWPGGYVHVEFYGTNGEVTSMMCPVNALCLDSVKKNEKLLKEAMGIK